MITQTINRILMQGKVMKKQNENLINVKKNFITIKK